MSPGTRWLLALYPRPWRDRYGREVASLTEELIRAGDTTLLRAMLGLAASAAVERARTLSRLVMLVISAVRAAQNRAFGLLIRNLVFTVVVPGLGGAWAPWRILTHHGHTVTAAAWAAVPVIATGIALYVWCAWKFAAVGRGTPGPWDAPSRVVAAGPYRWVRNPIYIAALLVVLGEAWLFMSLALVTYAGAMAILFHLFVTGYEERILRRRFGDTYQEYRHTVPRWIPRRPAAAKD